MRLHLSSPAALPPPPPHALPAALGTCPHVAPTAAVCGPPRSGKTGVARRLAKDFGCVLVTPAMAIERVVSMGHSLALQIESLLRAGRPITDDLTVAAVASYLALPEPSRRGWVLDGFPATVAQARMLEEWGRDGEAKDGPLAPRAPGCVVVLELSLEEALKRAALPDEEGAGAGEAEDAADVLKEETKTGIEPAALALREDPVQLTKWRYEAHSVHGKGLAEHYRVLRCSPALAVLDAREGRWKLQALARRVMSRSLAHRRSLAQSLSLGQPALLRGVGLRSDYAAAARSRFASFCPVAWARDGRLVNCSDMALLKRLHPARPPPDDRPDPLRYGALWRGRIVHLSTRDALHAFLEDPGRYVLGRALPPVLPFRLVSPAQPPKDAFVPASALRPAADGGAAEAPKDMGGAGGLPIAYRGCCPVALADAGPRLSRARGKDALIRGNSQFSAAYHGELFFCASEDALLRFLGEPWRFVGLRMPHKVPPPEAPLPVAQLASAHGYLEQCMGPALSAALLEVGQRRPLFPFRSVVDSALKCVALSLKAHNPNVDDRKRAQRLAALEEFLACTELAERIQKEGHGDGRGERFDALASTDIGSFLH